MKPEDSQHKDKMVAVWLQVTAMGQNPVLLTNGMWVWWKSDKDTLSREYGTSKLISAYPTDNLTKTLQGQYGPPKVIAPGWDVVMNEQGVYIPSRAGEKKQNLQSQSVCKCDSYQLAWLGHTSDCLYISTKGEKA